MFSDNVLNSGKRRSTSFNPNWEIPFLCKNESGESQCLVCKKRIISKTSNVKRHYEKFHAAEFSNFHGEERKNLHTRLNEMNIQDLQVSEISSTDVVRGSYEIAQEIARGQRPFSEGEFVKTCLIKVVKILSKNELPKYEAISLSRATISRRIQNMAEDLKLQLKDIVKEFIAVSFALDESTDVGDIAQLAIFVRGVDKKLNVTEELLALVPMKGTTTDFDIFQCFVTSVEGMGILWERLECIATDGARSFTGKEAGLVGRLRKKFEDEKISKTFTAIHCLIHQEALCARAVSFQNIMKVVVKIVNFVRAHGLNHGQFREFLKSIESEHIDVPYFTEVRWLSRGSTLKRFFELRVHISDFLTTKGKPSLELQDPSWIADLAFFTDITQHLNELNLKLQGRNQLIWKMCDQIQAFQKKLALWKTQLEDLNFNFFPCVSSISGTHSLDVSKFNKFIIDLENEFQKRFAEIQSLQERYEVIVSPFSVDPKNICKDLQMEMIDFQCDTALKTRFKEYSENEDLVGFYKILNENEFPNLKRFAAQIMSMFGSTYSCEQFFSLMKLNKPRLRAGLSDENMESTMRVATARCIMPNIDALVAEKRCQVSL